MVLFLLFFFINRTRVKDETSYLMIMNSRAQIVNETVKFDNHVTEYSFCFFFQRKSKNIREMIYYYYYYYYIEIVFR